MLKQDHSNEKKITQNFLSKSQIGHGSWNREMIAPWTKLLSCR